MAKTEQNGFNKEVHHLEAALSRAEKDLVMLKEEVKEQRATVTQKAEQLRGFIRDNTPPLFDQSEPDKKPKPDADLGPDAWSKCPIADLGLPETTTRALLEAKLDTLGKVQAYLSGDGFNDFTALTDLVGIGPAAAKKYEEATLKHRKDNAELYPPVK